MPSELSIKDVKVGNAVKISISGEVDIYTSQELKNKLYSTIEDNRLDLGIDCAGLNYIDSTGLGVFVGALKKAKQFERNIYLYNLKDNIKKLFLITGLDKLFIIE